jgi:hypothetical protein
VTRVLGQCLLSIAAIAQIKNAHAQSGVCQNDSDNQNTRICEYSDGRARTETTIDDYHAFHTYTAQQWKVKKAKIERMRNSAACAKASDSMSDEYVHSDAWVAASKIAAKVCGRY